MTPVRKLAAIMFTDISGYTALMQRSEQEAVATRQRHRNIFEPTTLAYHGQIIQYYGDGTLSIFNNTADAVRCARELQLQFLTEPVIPVRIGIHTGDIILSDDDIIGNSVNLASRVESLGVPGSVLVTGKVADEIQNQEDLPLVKLGSFHFKNDGKKREVYALDSPGLVIPRSRDMQGKLEKPKSKRERIVRAMATIAGILLLGLLLWLNRSGPGVEYEQLAVLPLFNQTDDSGLDRLVDGVHNALINELQQAGIVARGRTSVIRYRDTDKSIPSIAEELSVQALLEGAVYRADDTLGIYISMIDGKTENVIWTQTFQKGFKDVISLYNEVIRDLSGKIHHALSPEALNRLNTEHPVDPRAYKAYLNGQQHWFALTRESLDLAEKYFERARDIDPGYGPAYAGLAAVLGGRLQQGFVAYEEAKVPIRVALVKALQYGSDLPEVQFWKAVFSTWWAWEWKDAEKAYSRALALNPNSPETHAYYAHFLFFMNRKEEALQHMETAMEQDPFNPLFRALYGMSLNFSRRYGQVINMLTKDLQIVPTDPVALSTLRTTYHLTGDYENAIDTWKRFYAVRKDTVAIEMLEKVYQEKGYHQALESLAQLLIDRSKTRYVTPWQIATLYTRAGKNEKALDWLEEAYRGHDANMPYISVDPIFDDLRSTDRFQNLLRLMGLAVPEVRQE